MLIIDVEDLVANLLIEKMERGGSREVFFSEVYEYGNIVVQKLLEKRVTSRISINEENVDMMLRRYSNFFVLFSNGKESGIRLKPEVSTEDLWNRFRGYLSTILLKIFQDSFCCMYKQFS